MIQSTSRIAYIATPETITVVLDNKPRTIQVKSKSHRNGVILALEKFKKSAQSALDRDELEKYLAPINRVVLQSDSRFEVDESGKVLYLVGTKIPIPSTLSSKILDFLENGLPVDSLAKFWESCLRNPHYVAVEELFIFLEENHLPITEDGAFLGYKKLNFVRGQKYINVPDEFEELLLDDDGKTVRSITGKIVTPTLRNQYLKFISESNNPDMVDVHSGTIHQKVGEIVRIERVKLNEIDRRNSCGYGLHIGAFSYAFSGNVRVLCKVFPEDVIAANEGQAKLRTCKYQIVSFVDEAKEVKEMLIRLNSQEQDVVQGNLEIDEEFDNIFLEGESAKCIDTQGDDSLMLTGIYRVLETDGDDILIVNEDGEEEWYDSSFFVRV